MDLWQQKLAAYLHDPPEKPYDFGPAHKQRAMVHAQNFGVGEVWQAMGGNPDWAAAAADRFVFPHGSKVGGLGDDNRVAFVHPVSGRLDDLLPSLPAQALVFPSHAHAQEWLGAVSPDWRSKDTQTLYLLAWRQWWESAAGSHCGQNKGAELLPYLPADTRCPDGTIWHHCAVVSALEACREANDFKLPPRPAFLLFQVGPVQEFIAQARSTRDLWSGSYLLSWLVMHATKAVADKCGPDAIIFPSLRGQPLYDFLESQRLCSEVRDTDALVPGIPNRFLAVVPAGFDPAVAEKGFRDEWKRIAAACRQWLEDESRKHGDKLAFTPPYDALFERQVACHWHITWQLLPWASADHALRALARLPLGRKNPLHLARIVAESIPEAHKDERCYRDENARPSKHGCLDPGWAWSAHYQLCQHALDARRSLRDFPGSRLELQRKPGERDALSGREEAVVQADALQNLKSDTLRALFRHTDPLGAANLIKRVWHQAYLARLDELEKQQEHKLHPRRLRRATEAFDSVPAVAARPFAKRLHAATEKVETLREKWRRFLEAASAARNDFPDFIAHLAQSDKDGARWLEHTDHSVFFSELWRKEAERTTQDGQRCYHSPEARQRLLSAEAALRDLLSQAKAQPSRYYAVLALDGDEVGRWLSGEKSPAVGRILSPKAREYFEQKMLPAMTPAEKDKFASALAALKDGAKDNTPEEPDGWQGQWPPQSPADWIRAWLACPRPLSPSWHLQFSEALANFGLHAARRIVEDAHCGRLIYSGGDDVLAMLPADEAIACATDLRAAFQGRPAEMSPACQEQFRGDSPEGFLWLKKPRDNGPRSPLLVPGPRMTVSVGLAIGHVKEPLQDMIQEAQRAEKRAKNQLGRNALAATLFKRSGETVPWGARFDSPAFPLLKLVQRHFRAPWNEPKRETAISGRFPYRLAELLRPYQNFGEHYGLPDYSKPQPLNQELLEVALSEFSWLVGQQCEKLPKEEREQLCRLVETYFGKLIEQKRPLLDFVNLFLLEAFIRRQAD